MSALSFQEKAERNARAVAAIQRVYEFHGAGGACHIVTDDENVDDSHIEFCYEWLEENKAEYRQEEYDAYRECLDSLKPLGRSTRLKVIRRAGEPERKRMQEMMDAVIGKYAQ